MKSYSALLDVPLFAYHIPLADYECLPLKLDPFVDRYLRSFHPITRTYFTDMKDFYQRCPLQIASIHFSLVVKYFIDLH